MEEYAALYGKLRASILSRHFAINRRFRTHHLYHGNTLGTERGPAEILAQPREEQLKDRWRIDDHGGENPLLFSGQLLTCLAIEHVLTRSEAMKAETLKILRLALQSIGSLYKFPGNHFDGYILRWDPVMSDHWQDNGLNQYSHDFLLNEEHNYLYCTPLDDPRAIGQRTEKQREQMSEDEWIQYRDHRWTWVLWYRSWEPSMDELVGLILGYDMVYRLLSDEQNADHREIRDDIRRQVNNLGDYLAEHGYLLVRPQGGFTARGASGILPALEFPFGRVFQRITGEPYEARVDFVGAMQKAGVWPYMEETFNWATAVGWWAELALHLATLGGYFAVEGLSWLVGNTTPLNVIQLAQIGAIFNTRDCFDVGTSASKNDQNPIKLEFCLAYAMMQLRRGPRFQAWMGGAGLSDSIASQFAPFVALTGLDDEDATVHEAYRLWLTTRQEQGFAIRGFTSAVAAMLGTVPNEEERLVSILRQKYDEFHGQWQDDLSLMREGQTSERTLLPGPVYDALDYMVTLALAWLHAQRQADAGTPVTTPGFPQFPDLLTWPAAAVPNVVIDAARAGEIQLPGHAIQRDRDLTTVQRGHDGADLFLDDHPPAKSDVPVPVVTLPSPVDLVYNRWVEVRESGGEVNTGMVIMNGDELQFEATGEIWAGVWLTGNNGPEGWSEPDHDTKFPGYGVSEARPFCLLGKIGEFGRYFLIGSRRPKDRERERYLYDNPDLHVLSYAWLPDRTLRLRINDDIPGNGNGAFQCHVRVWGEPRPRRPALRVRMTPSEIPLGIAVQVTVHAEDAHTHVRIPGTVKIDGQEVGPTDVSFTHTFRTKRRRVFDPELRVWICEEDYPIGTVSTEEPPAGPSLANKYPDADIPFTFYSPVLRLTVEPSPLPIGREVRVTVHAIDSHTQAPISGEVLINGQHVGDANADFPYTFGTSVPAGRVQAEGYPNAVITWPPLYSPELLLTVKPSPILMGRPVEVTVQAEDARTRVPIPGKVILNGQDMGYYTNTPFRYTFGTSVPAGLVRAEGYPDAVIAWPPLVTYSANFRNISSGIGGNQL